MKLDRDTTRRSVALVLLGVAYYAVAVLTVKLYGKRYIVPVWSFPLLVFTLLILSERDAKNKLSVELSYLSRFIIANALLVIILIIGFSIAKYTKCRSISVLGAFMAWAILSVGAFLWSRESTRTR